MDAELAAQSRTVDPEHLGQRIKSARIAAGLTQAQLGGEEASTAYVSRIENGQRRPSVELLTRIADRLGTTVEALVLGAPEGRRDEWRLALDYAELALNTGDARTALHEAERIAAEASTSESRAIVLDAGYIRAGALEALGDLDAAIRQLEDVTKAPEPSPRWIKALIALTRCHREQGDFSRAIAVGEAAMASVEALGLAGLTESIQLTVTVAGSHMEVGDLDHALRMCQRAIEDAERVGSPIAKASAYWNASAIVARKGSLDSALQTARRALAAFEEGEDARNLGRLRTQVAELHLRVSPPDPVAAQDELRRAASELHWAATTPIDKADHYLINARAHHLLGEDDEAIAELRQACELAGDSAPLLSASAAVLAGTIAASRGDATRARADYETAIRRLSGVGADRSAAQLWFDLAGLLDELGDRDGALDAYRRAAASTGLVAPAGGQVGVHV